MASLTIKAPDGKSLTIQVPEGTDPSQYDQVVEEVVADYQGQQARSTFNFEASPEYPNETATSLAPNLDLASIAMAAPGAFRAARAVPGVVRAIPELVEAAPKAIAEGLGALKEPVGETLGNLAFKAKKMLPNPSLRGLGYGPQQVGTEAGQELAQAAREYATTPHEDIGQLVAKATQPVKQNALIDRAAREEVLGHYENLGRPPMETAGQTSAFESPIAEGMGRSAPEMRDLANEQWRQVGEAIDNTLQGLNATGEKFDPSPILDKVKSMYFRDAQGKIMTSGVQGETNQAISDALESLKGYANGEKIGWDEANKVKSMLQDSANYAAKRFEESNEAYKQVASLIKEGIDDQAQKVLMAHGGDIKDFQALRGAYSKLSSLRGALNPAAGKELLQPSLGESLVNAAKKAVPFGLAVEGIRRLF